MNSTSIRRRTLALIACGSLGLLTACSNGAGSASTTAATSSVISDGSTGTPSAGTGATQAGSTSGGTGSDMSSAVTCDPSVAAYIPAGFDTSKCVTLPEADVLGMTDDAAYVIHTASQTVYRIDLPGGHATPVGKVPGTAYITGTVTTLDGKPTLMVTGGKHDDGNAVTAAKDTVWARGWDLGSKPTSPTYSADGTDNTSGSMTDQEIVTPKFITFQGSILDVDAKKWSVVKHPQTIKFAGEEATTVDVGRTGLGDGLVITKVNMSQVGLAAYDPKTGTVPWTTPITKADPNTAPQAAVFADKIMWLTPKSNSYDVSWYDPATGKPTSGPTTDEVKDDPSFSSDSLTTVVTDDGKYLVFSGDSFTGKSGVWYYDTGTKALKQVQSQNELTITGTDLDNLYVSYNNQKATVDLTTGKVTPLKDGVAAPSYSSTKGALFQVEVPSKEETDPFASPSSSPTTLTTPTSGAEFVYCPRSS